MPTREFKLLIVDDEEDISFPTQSYFKKRGFNVTTTESGAEALELVESFHPDVVILDLSIKDLDGLEVLRRIRAANKKIRVIIVTGQIVKKILVEEVVALGISEFMNKPIILIDIEKAIFDSLQNNTHLKIDQLKRLLTKQPTPFLQHHTHSVANLLGIIRNKCENYASNYEEGFYAHKKPEELIEMAVKLMKEVQVTVDKTMELILPENEDS